jgi:hypothetical protein
MSRRHGGRKRKHVVVFQPRIAGIIHGQDDQIFAQDLRPTPACTQKEKN